MNDLISRQAVIDLFEERLNGWTLEEAIPIVDRFVNEREQCDDVWHAVVTIRDIAECVKQDVEKYLPSAEPKTGEWVEEDEHGDLWVCDQCGFASERRDNYCPNCGAKMIREDDEDGACSWDVICQYGSYGGDEGLLEGMGDIFEPDVEGWLTAADVIERIEGRKGE